MHASTQRPPYGSPSWNRTNITGFKGRLTTFDRGMIAVSRAVFVASSAIERDVPVRTPLLRNTTAVHLDRHGRQRARLHRLAQQRHRRLLRRPAALAAVA